MPKLTQTEHEQAVNAFIPLAEREAGLRVRKFGQQFETRIGSDHQRFRWSFYAEFFADAMNRLTSEAGLRVLRR